MTGFDPQGVSVRKWSRERILLFLGALALVAGLLMPWLVGTTAGGEVVQAGYETALGLFTGAVGLMVAVLILLSWPPDRKRSLTFIVLAFLALAASWLEVEVFRAMVTQVESGGHHETLFQQIAAGAGYYVSLAGGMLVLMGGVLSFSAASPLPPRGQIPPAAADE
jgi:hypothetical protein